MKKYAAYFGRNAARIVYLISVGFLGLGVFNVFLYSRWLGGVFCTIGAILFIFTSAKQVSDKHIDELVSKTENEYVKTKIEGKIVDKSPLDGNAFSVFSGFIRDSGSVRFKAGGDQKIRTSRFFVTALSVQKNDFKIFKTVYDIIADKEIVDEAVFIKNAENVSVKKTEIEFPRGIFGYEIGFTKGGNTEVFKFYLPDDALADKLISKIK